MIHKSYDFIFYDDPITLCDQLINKPMSRLWKDVTCKKCLNMRKLSRKKKWRKT